MSEVLTISANEIFHQLKFSCQIPSVIERVLHHQIIARTATEAGIEVKQEELQQAADSWRLINKLESPESTWLWLQKHHISLEEFGDLFYPTVVSSKLAEYLFAKQVEPFFLEHQLDYAGVVLYEIVLDDEGLALELFCALTEGEISFPELAYQYIEDKELSRIGGYRGTVYRKELKPEISAAVFAATPPQILKPIVTASGVHLLKVEEHIQPQLDKSLRQKILSTLFSNWLKQQSERFEVKLDLNVDRQKVQLPQTSSRELAEV